jgi:RNA polymerase sigma-70 factor, ECF subfamily
MNGVTALDTASDVLDEAAAGDPLAFARIVAAHHPAMLRVAYGICGDTEVARDAVQAAWLIAWRKLGSVREPKHLRSWLVTVAANETRHLVRRHHTASVREIPIEPFDSPREDGQAGAISRVDLANALRRLNTDDRTLIALRYGAGLDSAEIGPFLGLSPAGVRSRLMRLMARLRKELDDA